MLSKIVLSKILLFGKALLDTFPSQSGIGMVCNCQSGKELGVLRPQVPSGLKGQCLSLGTRRLCLPVKNGFSVIETCCNGSPCLILSPSDRCPARVAQW